CTLARQAPCSGSGGVWQGAGTSCGSVSCSAPGACCFASTRTCQIMSVVQCSSAGGTFAGGGTTCANSCALPPPGSVAILGSENTVTNLTDVQAKLNGTGRFPFVATLNSTSSIPPLNVL